MHAGVLITATQGRSISTSWSPDEKWTQLLVHLVVSQNIVCLRFDPSFSEEQALADIQHVRINGESGFQQHARAKFVHVGECNEIRLASGARICNDEVEKPLFPLSRKEEDTSCLHFAMRLLYSFGCMPDWSWLTERLPGAPMTEAPTALGELTEAPTTNGKRAQLFSNKTKSQRSGGNNSSASYTNSPASYRAVRDTAAITAATKARL
jgi:hypothetical protein